MAKRNPQRNQGPTTLKGMMRQLNARFSKSNWFIADTRTLQRLAQIAMRQEVTA